MYDHEVKTKMYEDFRRDLTDLLVCDVFLNKDQVSSVLEKVDQLASGYKFEKSSRELTIYEYHIPVEIDSYYNQKLLEGQSIKGLYARRKTLQNFFTYVHKRIEDITPSDVKGYLLYYKQARNISNRSLDKNRQVINAFFEWCRKEKIIIENPSENIAKFKYAVTPRGFLSEMELEKVRSSCTTKKEKLIVEFFYSTGCRIEEATRVKMDDLDLKNGEVLLFGKGSKYRKSYLDAKCIMAITDYIVSRKHQSDYLFNNEYAPYGKITTCALRKQFEKITIRALGKVVTPHIMRHTTATHALRKGMPLPIVQKLLGHSNPATTQIYAECDQEEVKNEHRRTIG